VKEKGEAGCTAAWVLAQEGLEEEENLFPI
jgi:hypothetical protein